MLQTRLAALLACGAAASARAFAPALPPPLMVFYSASHQDNAVVATLAGAASLDATYAFVHASAPLVSNATTCSGGAVPLGLYANAATHHHFTTGSARGAAWAGANGFSLVGVQGCVLAAGDASTIALEQWSSAARGDHFLVADAESRADAQGAGYTFDYIDSYAPAPWVVWPNEPHAGIPWPRSADLLDAELEWGRNAVPPNIGADTWYPSWASDGNLYSSFTDGTVAGVNSHSYSGHTATTGYASFTVSEDSRGRPDPFNMTMFNVATFPEPADPYESRYPSLNFHLDGVWYYGTYALNNYVPGVNPGPDCGNWCVQCPFDGIRFSRDNSKTWTAPRINMSSPTDNLFGETCLNNTKVKFGAPHAVDFGQNNHFSPDGRLYIVGHGAESPESHQAWMQGDSVYMARTVAAPSPDTINDAASWEFYSGGNGAAATWSGQLADAKPLIVWMNNTGVVTMSWHPTIAKFILVVSTPSVSPSCVGNFDTYFLESDSMTGPWAYVSYMASFGPEAYFVHFPGRFMDLATYAATPENRAAASVRTGPHAPLLAPAGAPPGAAAPAPAAAAAAAALEARAANLTEHLAALEESAAAAPASYYNLFLSYSADFASGVPNPPGSGYHWSLQSFRLGLSSAFAKRLAARGGEPLATAPL